MAAGGAAPLGHSGCIGSGDSVQTGVAGSIPAWPIYGGRSSLVARQPGWCVRRSSARPGTFETTLSRRLVVAVTLTRPRLVLFTAGLLNTSEIGAMDLDLLVVQLRTRLEEMSPAERLDALDRITADWCITCGRWEGEPLATWELFAERLADRDYMTSAGSDARNAATANHQRSQHLHELHTCNAEALAEVLGIDPQQEQQETDNE